MRIAYVEDEKEIAKSISDILKKVLDDLNIPNCRISNYYGSEDFFQNWSALKYDIIFLDIFLKDGHGVDIARRIRETDKEASIIFCSTSNEFATESYEVGAGYYLTKPVSYEKMRTMIVHIIENIVVRKEFITLNDGQKLLINQMIFSEYHNHLIHIKMKDSLDMKTWSSQKDFVKAIQLFDHLLPITPGTVINMNEVDSFDQDMVLMSDGSTLPISRRHKKQIHEKYQAFLFEKLRRQ